MIDCISIRNCFNTNFEYLLKVYTKDTISRLLKQTFHSIWRESFVLRKRRVEITYNEIRIYLRKEDIIQKYIHYVSAVLCQAENQVKRTQSKQGIKKKRVILKRVYPAKSYTLQHKHTHFIKLSGFK